jgi:RHS repeat-associated protein
VDYSRPEDKSFHDPKAADAHGRRRGDGARQEGSDRDSIYTQDRLKIPKIELPKGGGALKAIDEKFRVNATNGTVSLSISLPLSKSRSDFAPALSLDYNSGGGNGVFGLGWSLTHPAIQRKTDKRLPDYDDAAEGDVFVLSGQEDLVPLLLDAGGGNWTADAFVAPTGEAVKRYRPRIEGAFARIERITPAGAATFYWKITSKENVATIYGRSAAARIADPSDSSRIFKWLPELSYDDKGNCLEYLYLPEDFRTVANALHEGNRLSGLAPCANAYLKRAIYGNKNPYYADPTRPYDPQAPDDPAYFFELVFDYGDHDADAPTSAPQIPWACRLDPLSDYKPGFEVRTYRLCRRVLLFHTFKELNDGITPASCLVRSLDIDYRYFNNPAATAAELRNMEVDYPAAIRQTGWVKTGAPTYDKKSLPAIELTYQELSWDKTVQAVSADNIANAPVGLSRGYNLVDLLSEGISGILTEQAGAWFYKNNLGSGRFAASQVVAPKPSFAGLAGGTLQLLDLEADGRKFLVANQAPLHGAFELSDDGDWQPFAPFRNVPNVASNDPNVKFIDLDGDGRADIAVSEENVFTWYPSAGIGGYGAPRAAPKPFDEEKGPALVFSDPTGSIFLANMSGSGLTDIVRVRNGEVCYWPSLGYGRFGAKVSMDFAPVFDAADLFNSKYIHLADVTGTGAADILYLGRDKFRAWLNQSGNAWSEATDIDPFPSTELTNQLSVSDILGNGTACLVWSSELPRYAGSPMRYVDLMGGKKPYLLSSYNNQSGKEITLEYRSSTSFYLADKSAGKPWITKLPFPVHCLAKASSRDTVTGSYLATEYVYHHGYYDHAEREYRGFGCVEQTDTETFDNFVKSSAANVVDQPLHQAPVLTKTWFHTGAFFTQADILARFRSEYFQNGDFAEYHLPVPQVPANLSADERREAQRACKGTMIRQEIYGLDNVDGVSSVPYSAAERTCLIQRLQPSVANSHAAFLVTESESITYTYERNSKDPRIAHSLNAAIDLYGNILESASVAYPRQPGAAGLPARVQAEQQKLQIVYTVNGYTKDWIDNAAYRLRLPCETATFELTGATPAASYFTGAEIGGAFAAATPIKYEEAPDGSSQKRAMKHSRSLFLKDDLTGPLPLGQIESLGLAYETYRLTFTGTLLAVLYGTQVTPAFVAEGAYVRSNDLKTGGLFPVSDPDGDWWAHHGHATYPAAAASTFYMPNAYQDALGKITSVSYYADYQLLVQAVTDAVGNVTSVQDFNFRNLEPQLVSDANANLSGVRFDALGFVVGTALQGKGGEADDFTGFVTDPIATDVASFFADPVANGPTLLQHATSRFVYDFSVIPMRVASIVRETHFQAAAASGIASKLQYSFEYSDGFGNVAMRKLQAEPGVARALDGADNVISVDTTPNLRWVGNGRTVVNNKGKPVKQYEPYFSTTHDYENDPQLVEIGVTSLLYYDPVGRNVRTEYPNGTFSQTDIQGWMTQNFDQNDTVVDSDWYAQRTTGSLAADPQENQAAVKAAVHYATPAVSHSDGLGRAFYAVSHNKFIDHTTHALSELFYETDTQLDIEAKTKRVIDPRGNTVVSYDYDMLGNQAHNLAVDAGERWLLNDCEGNKLYAFDSKQQVFHTVYDDLRRPTDTTVAKGAASPIVFDRITYGEGQPGDQANNLRGRIFEHRDQAGVLASKSYDFKGNVYEIARVLTDGYQADVDWNAPPPLQPDSYTTQTDYDALNRPTRVVAPSSSAATASVLLPAYNESNRLDSVSAHVRGAAAATAFVSRILYNEKGQRARIDYANGTTTIYKYDTDTFRLIGLVTARNTDPQPFWDDKSKIDLPAFAGDVLQFLTYTYDPVGNVTYVRDDAQQPVYFDNKKVEPSADHTFDAVYRLVQSLGREHVGGQVVPGPFDDARMGNPQPGDGRQLQTYALQYDYDAAGNMVAMNNVTNWSMAFTYGAANNQLLTAVAGGAVGTPFTYPYDEHGNTTAMPHLTTMDWDFADRLRHTAVSASGSVTQESWYVYDASGQRVRKVVVKGNVSEERLYLGGVEFFRRTRGGTTDAERATLHVSDDTRRIAMVDTPILLPAGSREIQLIRYQYANQLDTACLELDGAAKIISYEEYYPFGNTSYQGTDQSREVPAKRYRYIGKERDDDSGFYYCGARYYAPWLARWTAADPTGIKDGPNVYAYCRDNPIRLHDPGGTQSQEKHVDEVRPPDPPVLKPIPQDQGTPPADEKTDSQENAPATTFANQTQNVGPPGAGGGSRPGNLDIEYNLIPSYVWGKGPTLLASGYQHQLSARIAPIPGLPNLTVGGFGYSGPTYQQGMPSQSQQGGGITAQYGWNSPNQRLGIGGFMQGSASGGSSGPTTYNLTVTPIIQYQANEKWQLVANPTFSVGTGGSFVNQGSYGAFTTWGGLVGAQFNSHLILEGGATRTSAARLPGDTTGSTSELRLIGGVGVTGSFPVEGGGGLTLSAVVNPFVGIPSGAAAPSTNVTAFGGMLTLTLAFRIPLSKAHY